MTTLCSHRSFACLVAVVIVGVLSCAAPIASAQTSQSGYTPPSSNVQAEIQDSPSTPSNPNGPTATTATTVHRSGSTGDATLPFTGLDLGFIALAGVGFVLVGFTLRRMTVRGTQIEQRNAAA